MSIFFETTIFSFLFSWTPRQCCALLFLHAQFPIETSGALFTLLAMRLFRTFEIKRGTKYGFYIVYGTCYFIFRVAASIYDQTFLEHAYLKESRWWCAHDTPIMYFCISAHNHGIPTHASILDTRPSLYAYREASNNWQWGGTPNP